MSRQIDEQSESRVRREAMELDRCCTGGLEANVGRSGAELIGFSAKVSEYECLLTVRVILAGRRQISFVGSETLAGALRKLARSASKDELRFRQDKYEPLDV